MNYLKPLSSLYEKLAGFKNELYDRKHMRSLKLSIPVISLGNLTLGGTGKTPLTDFCVKYYQRHQLKTAVISRNYRAEVSGIAVVDIKRTNAAAYFGDEPTLLAERNPGVSFFVGPRKFKTALYAVEEIQPQLLILDDGFQHRQLARDIDIVILDATEPLINYECLPAGRAREAWSSLARASVFVVSKVNLVSAETLEALYEKLRPFGKTIVPASYEIAKMKNLQSGAEKSLRECLGQAVMLISGIAQPSSFEKSLEPFSLNTVNHLVYKDHHPYSATDIHVILQKWQTLGRPQLLTTEKDFIKLKSLWPQDVPLWYAPLAVKIQSHEKEFYEILDQALR